jgi:hypothetical protein
VFVDDLFQNFMKIYFRFPKIDKPSGQEILFCFSYLIFFLEGYDLGTQIIFHSQDSYIIMKDRG